MRVRCVTTIIHHECLFICLFACFLLEFVSVHVYVYVCVWGANKYKFKFCYNENQMRAAAAKRIASLIISNIWTANAHLFKNGYFYII